MADNALAPLLYAYLGDAVFEVMVREMLIQKNSDPAACNREALLYVTAAKQAEAAKRIRDHLSEEEEAFFLHARNSKPHSIPQNAQPYDYHLATGLEALFGWLYCKGETERLKDLFKLAFN